MCKNEEILEKIKTFFTELWEAIVHFLKNLVGYIEMLLDDDFNYNLRFKYNKYAEDIKTKSVLTDMTKEREYVYEG